MEHVLFPFARWQHDHAQTPLPARPPWLVPGQWPQPVARGQGWLYVSTWTSMHLAPVRCRVLLHSLLPSDDNNNLYWNQVYKRNLLQWHTKQAATQDSTTLYNRTQSFGTQAFNSTKYNRSLARSIRLLLSARCPQYRNLINTNRNNERTHTITYD